MEHLFQLKQASLEVAGKALLSEADLTLEKGRVAAVMGPVATGKSVFLSALAGQLDEHVSRSGEWAFDGRPLPASGGVQGVHWVPQPKGVARPRRLADTLRTLREPCDVLLLDEPDFSLEDGDVNALEKLILERRKDCSVAVVTHNMDLVRACADDVVLLCASQIVASGAADDFFNNPPNELSKKWLATGNCWPAREPPPLPNNFNWVIPGELAGMAQPGLMGDVDEDLEAIALAGVTLLVTLTERAFPRQKLSGFGIEGRHFPIADMGVPGVSNTIRLCRGIQRAIEAEGAVAVHCRAGLGRTGTILACYLVYRGEQPERAIERVREHNPNYIQSESQLAFVRGFKG